MVNQRVLMALTFLSSGLCPACSGDDGAAPSSAGTEGTGGSSGVTATSSGTSSGSMGTGGGTTTTTAGGTSDSAGTGGSSGGATTGDPAMCNNAPGQLGLPNMPWNQPITSAAVAADSADVIGYLQDNVAGGARFQIDFSITVLESTPDTPRHPFTETNEFYSPDCDPAPMPIPAGGHIEGEASYACENGGDCHLIVVDWDSCRLYEQWRTNFVSPSDFSGGCLAIWELDRDYDETLRGDYCTSADAAGLPIAGLLFTADEVANGEISHALRFIVPNANIRDDIYVRPGTHSTPATSGPADAPPYSARLRLKADVDISGLNPAAQVVAEAMKTYGIILADAGNVTFTAADDDFSANTWESVGLGPHDLKDLQWSDFERVDTGAGIVWSEGDCARTPITD